MSKEFEEELNQLHFYLKFTYLTFVALISFVAVILTIGVLSNLGGNNGRSLLENDGPNGPEDIGFLLCVDQRKFKEDCEWCFNAFKVQLNETCVHAVSSAHHRYLKEKKISDSCISKCNSFWNKVVYFYFFLYVELR